MSEQQQPQPTPQQPPGGGSWPTPPPGYWAAPAAPPGWMLVPAPAPAPSAEGAQPSPAAWSTAPAAPAAQAPQAPRSIPGQVARWDARAYATLVDISIGTGIVTAYQMTLVMATPVMHFLVWLGGGVWDNVVQWGTWLLLIGWWGWQWVQRGLTGQSLGQRMMGVAVVDMETKRPVGPGRSVARSLTHVVDILPLWLGMVRPVWDPARQTWADKIHKTVAVVVDKPHAVR